MNEAPPPPFPLSRETTIRIDRDGAFWHDGERITHEGLARALASWVAIDPDTGRYIIANSVNWCFVTVDDAPLVVRTLDESPDGTLTVTLTDGATEPLDLATLRLADGDVPYCRVRRATLPARFSRPAAYALLERVADGRLPEPPRGRS